MMRLFNLILAIFISIVTYGQNKNLLAKLEQVESDFWYKINDSLEFKGTRWICTLPVKTFFTNVTYNETTKVLAIGGYFTLGGDFSDTVGWGMAGASIFLLNITKDGKIYRVFDLGETSDGYFA